MALGEMFGPVICEEINCSGDAWLIWMAPEEYDAAKRQTEVHPIQYVCHHKIGTALCSDHSPAPAGIICFRHQAFGD